jgi:hypothetical protein
MEFLRGSLSGLPISNTTTNLSYDRPGAAQTALGALGTGYSLYNMGKDSGLFKGLGSLFNTPAGLPTSSEMNNYTSQAMSNIDTGLI